MDGSFFEILAFPPVIPVSIRQDEDVAHERSGSEGAWETSKEPGLLTCSVLKAVGGEERQAVITCVLYGETTAGAAGYVTVGYVTGTT